MGDSAVLVSPIVHRDNDAKELMGGEPGKLRAPNAMAKRRNKSWVDKLQVKWMKEDQVD